MNFKKTFRTEESIGEEQRVIDNSKCSISLTRRFSVSKEWKQSFNVDYEKNQNQ